MTTKAIQTTRLRADDAVYHCVRLNRPEWFKRADWMELVNSYAFATWHPVSKINPTEYSDVFFTYDHGEGSNWGGSDPKSNIPDDIWQELCNTLGPDAFALVWVTNLGPDQVQDNSQEYRTAA